MFHPTWLTLGRIYPRAEATFTERCAPEQNLDSVQEKGGWTLGKQRGPAAFTVTVQSERLALHSLRGWVRGTDVGKVSGEIV